MQKWEYLRVHLFHDRQGVITSLQVNFEQKMPESKTKVTDYIGALGWAGWELVTANLAYSDSTSEEYIFKRPSED